MRSRFAAFRYLNVFCTTKYRETLKRYIIGYFTVICQKMENVMEISPINYNLVTDDLGNNVQNGDNILLQRISDQTVIMANADIVIQNFDLQVQQIDPDPGKEELNKDQRTIWSRNEILMLIHLYKEHEGQFKSSTIKNDKVWHNISEKIKTRTWEQCKNKFKYLKSKYTEKKDNMGDKSSGAKAVKFEFFEEMDEVFGSLPNVKPVAIACSSKGINNITVLNTGKSERKLTEELAQGTKDFRDNKRCADADINKENKKRKISEDALYKIHEMREEGRNRRHKEKIEVQKELINVIRELITTLKPK